MIKELHTYLIPSDYFVAFVFFLLRALLDLYYADKKVSKLHDEEFQLKIFFRKNGIRYIASFVASFALLITLPEGYVWFMYTFFDNKDVYWNKVFSGAIGYAPIELFLYMKKRIKKKMSDYENKY